MKTWTVLLRTEKGIFLQAKNNHSFQKTLRPKLMTYEEAKEISDFYKEFHWDVEPFDTENSLEIIRRLYNGTL